MSHILIIDDDIHINEMLEEVLIQEGYQVSHAYSGTEALLFLANEKPDLILLDLICLLYTSIQEKRLDVVAEDL